MAKPSKAIAKSKRPISPWHMAQKAAPAKASEIIDAPKEPGDGEKTIEVAPARRYEGNGLPQRALEALNETLPKIRRYEPDDLIAWHAYPDGDTKAGPLDKGKFVMVTRDGHKHRIDLNLLGV